MLYVATAAQQSEAHALAAKLVYLFGDGRAEATRDMREPARRQGRRPRRDEPLGIPVPPGFTITTEVCNAFYALGGATPTALEAQVARRRGPHRARRSARGFGDPQNPLLVSVRSGARVSMPGMMDTVLNLGLNDATAEGLARRSGNARFAYDSYRRFVAMYGDVVLGLERDGETRRGPVRGAASKRRSARAASQLDTELDAETLRELVVEYKAKIRERAGRRCSRTTRGSSSGAPSALCSARGRTRARSPTASCYGYPADWGTAVNVQAMVFGNLGDDCATGVVFTRNPATGERRLYGEYLVNAQGEDVVAGTRTPQPVALDAEQNGGRPALEEVMPDRVRRDSLEACERLERHFGDMQDIEFTMQQGRLWILQTRSGKRTGQAMVKVAVDMVAEGLIDRARGAAAPGARAARRAAAPGRSTRRRRREVIATGLARVARRRRRPGRLHRRGGRTSGPSAASR